MVTTLLSCPLWVKGAMGMVVKEEFNGLVLGMNVYYQNCESFQSRPLVGMRGMVGVS